MSRAKYSKLLHECLVAIKCYLETQMAIVLQQHWNYFLLCRGVCICFVTQMTKPQLTKKSWFYVSLSLVWKWKYFSPQRWKSYVRSDQAFSDRLTFYLRSRVKDLCKNKLPRAQTPCKSNRLYTSEDSPLYHLTISSHPTFQLIWASCDYISQNEEEILSSLIANFPCSQFNDIFKMIYITAFKSTTL